MTAATAPVFTPIDAPASLLGESPFWNPDEQTLWWVDIPGQAIHRFHPATRTHTAWPLPVEPGCIAPMSSGALMLAARDGLWRFDPATGTRTRLAEPPYDPATQRFNDGKADPQGRFWVGTIHDKREPEAALFSWDGERFTRRAEGLAASNGLAFSPDGRTLYWADTRNHSVDLLDMDPADGRVSRRRAFARMAPKPADGNLDHYAGRPDGAAMDVAGNYWVAMFEGQQLRCYAPDGELVKTLPLPVRCATMPCFGGPDLKTLYVTTARENRPAAELAAQPWAGRVLSTRVDVPGLPVNFIAG